MKMGTKRTPEEVKQQRVNSLTKARATRQANLLKKQMGEIHSVPKLWQKPEQPATSKPDAPHEFLGLTQTNCPIGCTPERCAIGGSLHFKNSDGTTTLEGVCTHPYKGGLKPIHQTKPVIVERFNRAVEYLEHLKIEQKHR